MRGGYYRPVCLTLPPRRCTKVIDIAHRSTILYVGYCQHARLQDLLASASFDITVREHCQVLGSQYHSCRYERKPIKHRSQGSLDAQVDAGKEDPSTMSSGLTPINRHSLGVFFIIEIPAGRCSTSARAGLVMTFLNADKDFLDPAAADDAADSTPPEAEEVVLTPLAADAAAVEYDAPAPRAHSAPPAIDDTAIDRGAMIFLFGTVPAYEFSVHSFNATVHKLGLDEHALSDMENSWADVAQTT